MARGERGCIVVYICTYISIDLHRDTPPLCVCPLPRCGKVSVSMARGERLLTGGGCTYMHIYIHIYVYIYIYIHILSSSQVRESRIAPRWLVGSVWSLEELVYIYTHIAIYLYIERTSPRVLFPGSG